MNNEQLYFYNRGFNDGLAKNLGSNPVKELTDEEIEQVYKETHFSETIGDCDYMDFARAILRKAQEK